MRNHSLTQNLVTPVTQFQAGEIWLESASGMQQLEAGGPKGVLLRLFVDNAPCHVTFPPRTKHATLPWSGARALIVAYHIQDPDLLCRIWGSAADATSGDCVSVACCSGSSVQWLLNVPPLEAQ